MKYIWVTGARGQFGQTLCSQMPAIEGYGTFFTDLPELDITHAIALRRAAMKHPPAIIINTAAYTNVDRAESEPELANSINGWAVGQLSMIAQAYDAWLLHISTDYIFDGKKSSPYIESDPPSPVSAYGYSKWLGEQAALKNPATVVLRTSWMYGDEGRNFVRTILSAVEKQSEVRVVSDQEGTPTYAADLADVIIKITHRLLNHSFEPGIYHYSNEGACSWYEFASAIMQAAGLPWRVIAIQTADYPLPAPRPAYSVLDKSKIKKALGISIPHWKDSLEVFIKKNYK